MVGNKEKSDMENKSQDTKISIEKVETEDIKDKFYIIYLLFFFLGLVHLLPWSFFTTATAFWMYKFRNTSVEVTESKDRTPLQAEFNASLSTTLQVTEVIFLILAIIFGRFIHVRTRLIGILTVILVFFIILTAFTQIDTDSWQEGFFAMVMAIVAGINAMNATFTITMYTLMAKFPHHYLAPYLTGTGTSRIFTSSLQIISLSLGMSTIHSALVYFTLGVLIIFFTLAMLVLTGQNKFYLDCTRNLHEEKEENMISFKEVKNMIKKIWSAILMMAFGIFSTNMSPTGLVVSEGEGNGPWNDVYFIPTITYLMATICTLIGRTISFRYSLKLSSISWAILAGVKAAVFIFLIMFCNAQPRHHLPVLFPHDYQYIIIIAVQGITEGYISTRSTYNIAELVNKEELKTAYHVNMLCMGLVMGVLSFCSVFSVELL